MKRSIDSLIEELGWLNPRVELTEEIVMDAVRKCGLEEPYLRHLQDNYALDGHSQMSAAKIGRSEGISANAAAMRVHKAVKAVSRYIYWRAVETEAGKSGTPIPFPQLSVRATNCLVKAHIITLEALVERSAAELLLIRNMGKKCIKELREMLEKRGLKFKGEDVEASDKKVVGTFHVTYPHEFDYPTVVVEEREGGDVVCVLWSGYLDHPEWKLPDDRGFFHFDLTAPPSDVHWFGSPEEFKVAFIGQIKDWPNKDAISELMERCQGDLNTWIAWFVNSAITMNYAPQGMPESLGPASFTTSVVILADEACGVIIPNTYMNLEVASAHA
jgi:hypothetical protein